MEARTVFTVGELGKRWGISTPQVLALIHTGRLSAFSISPFAEKRPRYRITQMEVDRFERGEEVE